MNKKLLIVVVVIAALCAAASAEDRRTDTSLLTIMTLNTEFMWDGVAPEEGSVNFAWKNSKTEAEEHMSAIARIIIRGNADIVNLVEIENKAALDTLNSKFLQGRGYRTYFDQGRDSATGQGREPNYSGLIKPPFDEIAKQQPLIFKCAFISVGCVCAKTKILVLLQHFYRKFLVLRYSRFSTMFATNSPQTIYRMWTASRNRRVRADDKRIWHCFYMN